MRILAVANIFPWPETSGARMRLANVLRGLSRLGEVDLFILARSQKRQGPFVVPSDAGVSRVDVVARPAVGRSTLARTWWLACGGLPSDFLGRDYRSVESRYREWAHARYDLTWFCRADGYVALQRCIEGRRIVDIDDLQDRKLAAALRVEREGGRVSAWHASPLRRLLDRLSDARDIRRWSRLFDAIVSKVDAVVVCSALDLRRLGARNGEVIPNGYAYQEAPVGRVQVAEPPIIVFQGSLTYRPNVDAAHYLVRRIAPLLRARLPGVRLRLVGTADRRVQLLHDPPHVVVTGFVEHMVTELARADLTAIPLRFGGGTRIKILEAFAHRVPVVSTTTGAEGIEAADDRELLIRDSPEAFADACVRLLTDEGSRVRLVEAAHRLFIERYRWDAIQEKVAALAARVAA